MAQLTVHGNWKSITAMACLFAFVGLLTYAIAAGTSLGLWLYLFAFLAIAFGFASKEDHIAVFGIMAFALLIILDIILRIGVLAFNQCHTTFGILSGC